MTADQLLRLLAKAMIELEEDTEHAPSFCVVYANLLNNYEFKDDPRMNVLHLLINQYRTELAEQEKERLRGIQEEADKVLLMNIIGLETYQQILEEGVGQE